MSYTVLARRYRSRTFDEIVGQEPIARTLQNAIRSGRTAHAYLFTGTRGVGKTSMARIFARALNTAGGELSQSEAIGEAILRGDDLDVIEIDGASHRGINEARELIAGAGLSPARCPYKIYIIDEVHQVTRDAFNALLKTMEEPPGHVKFILCTTEPNKVPATIQSRCQRFDFRPIPTARIAEHLQKVLASESVEADEAVIQQVARMGQGSLRDALSLLDRLLAAGEPRLTVELMEQMLGVPDQMLVSELMQAIIDGDPAATLRRGAALLAGGTSTSQAIELLTEYLRTLLVARTCGADSELLELTGEPRERAVAHAGHFDAAALVHMMAVCDAASKRIRDASTIARAVFDATVVRLSLSEHLADVAGLLAGEPVVADAASSAPPAGKKKDDPPRPPVAAPAEAAPTAEAPAPVVETAADMTGDVPADGPALWEAVVRFAQRSRWDTARVEPLRYEALEGGVLRLAIDESGARVARYLGQQAERIADLVERATGRRLKVHIEPATAPIAAPRQTDPRELDEVRRLPAVARAAELFDASVVEVRSSEADPPDPETPEESDGA